MVGPGSRMLFCWLLQNQSIWKQVWSLWIVQLERGTEAFAVKTFPADFYQNLNNALSSPKSQCFLRCPARIQSISHPSCSASELRNSTSTPPSSPSPWNYTWPQRFLLKSLEKRTGVLQAEPSVQGEYPGQRRRKQIQGIWQVRRDTVNRKGNREDFWGHPRSLWNPVSW